MIDISWYFNISIMSVPIPEHRIVGFVAWPYIICVTSDTLATDHVKRNTQIRRSVFLDSARFDPGCDWPHTCLTCSKQSAATCWSRGIETTFWGTRWFKVSKKKPRFPISGVFFLRINFCFWDPFWRFWFWFVVYFVVFLFGWVMSMLLDVSICLRCTR